MLVNLLADMHEWLATKIFSSKKKRVEKKEDSVSEICSCLVNLAIDLEDSRLNPTYLIFLHSKLTGILVKK